MDLKSLEDALESSWDKDTSSENDWSKENPSYGQCAVTALILEKYLGGKILWAKAQLPNGKEVSHYWNYILNQEIDITRKQFPKDTIIPKGVEMIERKKDNDKLKAYDNNKEYILSYTKTMERYKILEARVDEILCKK